MDYLDPKKELRSQILLMTGYVLIGVAIVIATLVLLYQAYGFGLDKKGAVIQNGLTFFSSQPHPADIYANGKLKNSKTNTRLVLPAGLYDITLARNGYYDWQRKIDLAGGSVQHYDYPFLFPKVLTTKNIQTFDAAPGLMTQSPDHRWLVMQTSASLQDLTVYDLKNPAKAPVAVSLPSSVVSKATSSEAWQLAEWADDNRHVLLQHTFDGKTEFVLVDRTAADQSLNLNNTLSASPTKITLNDKKYDQYYLYDAPSASLQKASIKEPKPIPLLQHVLSYKTYGNNVVLYATDNGAAAGKVLVKMQDGDKTYPIRALSAGASYSLDLTKYSGVMYVVAGSSADGKAYIYKDPVGQLEAQPKQVAGVSQVLRVPDLNYVSFSANAQYIVAENGNAFAVYDIENLIVYKYSTRPLIDPPQLHASWMDGNRLMYVSGGRLVVFDYDSTNQHTLMPAMSNYLPAFEPEYKFVYALAPTGSQTALTQTSLLAPADR